VPGWTIGRLPAIPDLTIVDPKGRELFLITSASPGGAIPDGQIVQVDARTGQPSPTIIGRAANSVSLTDDGGRLVVSGNDGTTVYDPVSGAVMPGTLPDIKVSVIAGDTLVGATFTGAIKVYDVNTFRQIGTLPGTRGYSNLQVSADGRTLVSSGGDQTVSIYDLTTRTRIGLPIEIGADVLNKAVLRPDGRAIAIGGGSHGIQIWDLDADHWATAACRLAGRNLTREEWNTYLSWAGPYHATCPGFDAGT